jgi:DNA invertase Pin-like site-specific DNA recombinase
LRTRSLDATPRPFSTVKQGTQGVSLEEQNDAIVRYAERNRFTVSLWLQEMETAAKGGRPVFNQALKLLRQGKYKGIILHKLDRGARNLKDWNAIGELADQGIEVHFVNESLDLHSRGGRLSADIQAVVAADYIRNLREETRKGFYGRLKQGLYPIRAPIGYADQGKGKPKTIDPVMGPLARKTFELYGTARYSFETLGDEMYRQGLRNHNGGRVTRNGLSTILHNPFYMGLIRIRKTNETFAGIHEPIISKPLFDRVQVVLAGKFNGRTKCHDHQFRRMLTCAGCKYSLIGERQKGHVYYRCHKKECATSIREETVDERIVEFLQLLRFNDDEKAYFQSKLMQLRSTWAARQEEETRNLKLRLDQIKERLNRLTDAYLDKDLDKAAFEERKKALLLEQKTAEEQLAQISRQGRTAPDKLEKFLELAGNPQLSHELGFPEERRELLDVVTSNRIVTGKNVELKPSIAFEEIINRSKSLCCDPKRTIPRTWDRILDTLIALNMQGLLPDLTSLSVFHSEHTMPGIATKT